MPAASPNTPSERARRGSSSRVMLFSFAVRSVYLESCSMFVRGGVYIVVRDAMGHFHGAPVGLGADVRLHPDRTHQRGQRRTVPRPACSTSSRMLGHIATRVSPNLFAAGFGILVTVYFWWSNIKGIHESSGKALRIMQITTVMVVAFLIWCPHHAAAAADTCSFRPLPVPAQSAVQRRRAGLVQRHHLAADRRRSRSSSPSATRCSP